MKKQILSFITFISLALTSSMCFAGISNWNGIFNFLDSKNHVQTVTHTPEWVRLQVGNFVMEAGEEINIGKNSGINDVYPRADTRLAVKMSPDQFTNEVNKLGPITKKQIKILK